MVELRPDEERHPIWGQGFVEEVRRNALVMDVKAVDLIIESLQEAVRNRAFPALRLVKRIVCP